MADELTPEQQRELDAIDRALSGRSVDPEFDHLAALTNELHEMRATPDPDYARDLDRRAAAWLGTARPERRSRFQWARLALPAAAAAAAVIVAVAVVGSGDDGGDERLELTALPAQPKAAMPQLESAPGGASDDHEEQIVGKELVLEGRTVRAGEPLLIRYEVLERAQATVQLAGLESEIDLAAGRGRLRIDTDDVEAGEHPLSVILQPGGSLHTVVTVE